MAKTLGILVIPKTLADGTPAAEIVLSGTVEPPSTTTVDADGAEIAVQFVNGTYHVVDYRSADATE